MGLTLKGGRRGADYYVPKDQLRLVPRLSIC